MNPSKDKALIKTSQDRSVLRGVDQHMIGYSSPILLSTIDSIPGSTILQVLGVARGNTIRSRHVGRDILATIKSLVGGEITDYTKMIAESREQALDRMVESALVMGANAIVGVRFETCSMMQGAAELLAYGTAVIIQCDDNLEEIPTPREIS